MLSVVQGLKYKSRFWRETWNRALSSQFDLLFTPKPKWSQLETFSLASLVSLTLNLGALFLIFERILVILLYWFVFKNMLLFTQNSIHSRMNFFSDSQNNRKWLQIWKKKTIIVWKTYIYIICHLRVKPLHIMLLIASTHVKVMMVKQTGCILCLKMMTYWKNGMIFGKMSVTVWKKNLIVNLCTIKIFYNPKKSLTMLMLQIFLIKKFLK